MNAPEAGRSPVGHHWCSVLVIRSRVRCDIHSRIALRVAFDSRESATLLLLRNTFAVSGMPIQLGASLQQVGRLPAGWVPAGTIPEVEDAVLNKDAVLFPVGDSFLLTEKDRAIFFDLRGGEVVAVEVFDAGDVRGGAKSPTVLVLSQDYAGRVCCKAMTGPAFQRLVLCARADMAAGASARQVREAAAIPGLDQKPVKLSKRIDTYPIPMPIPTRESHLNPLMHSARETGPGRKITRCNVFT